MVRLFGNVFNLVNRLIWTTGRRYGKILLVAFVFVATCSKLLCTPKGEDFWLVQSVDFTKSKLDLYSPHRKAGNGKDSLDFNDILTLPTLGKVVILFSTKRSGSTLLGEFFNRNEQSFYLFEPLFPYTRYCDILRHERTELLAKFTRCDFSDLPRIYKSAFERTGHSDSHSQCLKHNLCFSERSKFLLYRYAAACGNKPHSVNFNNLTRFVPDSSPCGYPLEVDTLSSLCTASGFIAYKILRVCNLQDIVPLTSNKNISIIYLVRDPRGVLASRLLLDNDELTPDTLEEGAKRLCEEMNENLETALKTWKHNRANSSSYLPLRYEDLARKPLDKAYEMFLGLKVPTSVKLWITRSFLNEENRNRASKDPYSTVKDVYSSINSWRSRLTIDQTLLIQKHCSKMMSMLHYKIINTSEEQKNLNITLW